MPLAWCLVSHEWLVSADLISFFGERVRCFRVGANSSFLARAPNTPSPFRVMAALRRNCSAAPSCRHLCTCTKVPVPVPAHTPRISSWLTSRMPKNRVTCRGLRPSALNFLIHQTSVYLGSLRSLNPVSLCQTQPNSRNLRPPSGLPVDSLCAPALF
jgi:hypothetical protein